MPDRLPIAYVRKSRVDPDHADMSWEVQEVHVRELAARHGDADGYRPYRAVYALPEEIDWGQVDSYDSYPEGYLD